MSLRRVDFQSTRVDRRSTLLSAPHHNGLGKFTLDRAVTVADLKTAPREDLYKALVSLAEISLMRGA